VKKKLGDYDNLIKKLLLIKIMSDTCRLVTSLNMLQHNNMFDQKVKRGCCGHDRMIVGFTTTCAISAYHH
jgi:hypothetical protein